MKVAGCPKYGWQDTIRKNPQSCSVNEEDAPDRVRLSSRIELEASGSHSLQEQDRAEIGEDR